MRTDRDARKQDVEENGGVEGAAGDERSRSRAGGVGKSGVCEIKKVGRVGNSGICEMKKGRGSRKERRPSRKYARGRVLMETAE